MEEIHIDPDIEKQTQGPKTKIEDKVKRILKLIKDCNLVMDGTPEEILKREPLAKLVKDIESITNELNVLQNKVESLQHQKSVLEEVLYVETIGENFKLIIQIESMKEEVDRKTLEQERLTMEDREHLTMEIGKLEFEMSTLKSKNSEDKEQMSAYYIQEINCLTQQKLELQDRITELEERSAERVSELSVLQDKNMDLQRTLEDRKDAYQKLNEEDIQIHSGFNKCKVKLEVANKKIKEMEEELSKCIASKNQMVDDLKHRVEDLKRDLEEKGNETSTLLENVRNHEENLRLSNQKLRDTEQLLSVKEESYRKVEEELQQVQREFHEGIGSKNRMVADLEHQVEDLRKLIKAIEECTRQQQMEAIRQLSLQVRGLKKTNDDLRDIISKSRSYCCLC